MQGKILVCAFVLSVAFVTVVSGSTVKAQSENANSRAFERSSAKAVGASIVHPAKLHFERDEYTYDGSYGYTLYEPEDDASHDHGPEPAIRVARDPQMKPGQIRREVKKTLDEYSGEIDVFSKKVKVGRQGLKGTAVGPIPGETPYIEVYVPGRGEVYRIDLYGTRIDAEAKELLRGIRFSKPQRSIASLDLPTVNSKEALYPRGGPEGELLECAEIPGATDDEPAAEEPATFTTQSTCTSSSIPTYGEKRIHEGCWRANSRFWLQTQHDSRANSARRDGTPTGFSIVGRPNYWGQYTHGKLKGYGRCKSNYYTNDKFAVDYPYNRGDRIYSPFKAARSSSPGRSARTAASASSS